MISLAQVRALAKPCIVVCCATAGAMDQQGKRPCIDATMIGSGVQRWQLRSMACQESLEVKMPVAAASDVGSVGSADLQLEHPKCQGMDLDEVEAFKAYAEKHFFRFI